MTNPADIARSLSEDVRDLFTRTVLVVVHTEPQRRAFITGYNGRDRPEHCSNQMRKNWRLGRQVFELLHRPTANDASTDRNQATVDGCGKEIE